MKKLFSLKALLPIALLLAATVWGTNDPILGEDASPIQMNLSGRACGDVNGDGIVNITDLEELTSYVTTGAPLTVPSAADMDGCPGVTLEDVQYMVEFMFCSGTAPCDGPPCNIESGGHVSLDHVRGLSASGLLLPGVPISYQIRMTNDLGTVIATAGNGFRIYSGNGAIWTSTLGNSVGTGSDHFEESFFIKEFSPDGMSADTVGFNGIGICGTGIPAGYDDVIYSVDIGPIDVSYSGKEICLDSSWYPFVGEWLWSVNPGERRIPEWDGPHCFNIADFYCGDVNGDGNPLVQIDDLVYLVDYFFTGGPPPPLMEAADVDGCQGVTVEDIVYLAAHIFYSGPAPCQGPPCNVIDAGIISLDHVDGETATGSLTTGSLIVFHLRYTNELDDIITSMANGFRVHSSTGVQWDHLTGSNTGLLGTTEFPDGFQMSYASIDGIGADTIGLMAAGSNGLGMPPGFDEIVMTLEIGPISDAYAGGQICLDSSWIPPQDIWTWGAGSGERRIPAWDGPYCFNIADFYCGDVNGDGNPLVQIDDLVYLVDYFFTGGPPPPLMEAADVDGCQGVTVEDIVYLAAHIFYSGPAPCQGPPCNVIDAGIISLDHVDGETATGSLTTGSLIVFHLRYTNELDDIITSMANGFRVHSSTGVQWDHLTGSNTGLLGTTEFPDGFQMSYASIDGIGADTIGLMAAGSNGLGMPPGFDEIVMTLEIGPISDAYAGGQICLDSSWIPPQDIWTWGAGSGERRIPGWGGPYCFDISNDLPCLNPIRGDVDYSDGGIDISDLVYLVSYMFSGGPPPPCFEEADMNATGGVDISDLIYLVDYMFSGGPAPLPCP